jgi:hypothetical protein
VAHASPHQRPAFGAWCLRAYSVDPKHVPGLRARPPLVRSSSHAGNTSSNLVGVGQRSLSRATHPSVEGWNRSGFSRGSIGLGEPSWVECGNVNDCAVDGVLRRHRPAYCAVQSCSSVDLRPLRRAPLHHAPSPGWPTNAAYHRRETRSAKATATRKQRLRQGRSVRPVFGKARRLEFQKYSDPTR